jgi:PAS domain S-box-containing protein
MSFADPEEAPAFHASWEQAEPGAFLAGTGELGDLIAAFDWSRTLVGPIAGWPQSLRLAVGMILRSPVAMALAWGEQGSLIYNAAYAEAARLGSMDHAAMLGAPVMEAWPDISGFSQEVQRRCLGGQCLTFSNQRFTFNRHGTREDVWLDLGCSPVPGEDGRPAGVLTVVSDITARQLTDERLRFAQEAGRFGTFEWYPQTRALVVSDVYREIYGFAPDEEVTEEKLLAMVPPQDHHFTGSLRLGHPGNPLAYAEYPIRDHATGAIRWIGRRGEILQGGPGAAPRYIGVAWDITEKKLGELQAAFLAALSDRLRELGDADAVIAVATEMLGRHLGAGRCGYGEILDQPDRAWPVIRIDREWNDGTMPSLLGSHRMEAFGAAAAEALHRGETLKREDLLDDPRFAAPPVAGAFMRIGTRAGLTVPLIRDGRLAGILYAHCAAPRAWTDRDEETMQAVAARSWDAAQRARAEQRLRDSEENFRKLAQAMPIHVWVADPAGTVLWVNEQAYAYTGAAAGDLQREDWGRIVHPDDQERAVAAWTQSLRDGTPYQLEYRLLRHDGAYRWHIARGLPIRDASGAVTRWIGTNTDIEQQRRALAEMERLNATLEERVQARTRELRQAEDALRQAQKMEAIGQLTGGIAHDFNNLLTGIIGALDLVQRRIARHFPPRDARLDDLNRFLDAAAQSAQRAASLTHRLLAFARRQPLDSKPVDVAEMVHGMADLLRRTLGEQVMLHIAVSPDCWHALTDPNQLESAILNLAINARDAMPQGGHLTIAATNMVLEERSALGGATADEGRLEPGAYVAVAVTDTGIGMSAEVMEKVFEPFFTTKAMGQGTGLGLSMVYGFTRQSGGGVRIASHPGDGSTITLYLPRSAPGSEFGLDRPGCVPRGAGETVLVVEDVPAVRMLIIEVLRELGYAAIEAADGSEALPILASPRKIDLLVSDVGLPGLNGRQIADYARELRPGLKVLFVTGYTEDAAIRNGTLGAGMAVLTKPFAISALAAKIGTLMGEQT